MNHEFGLGSLAEPCKHCRLEYAYARRSPFWDGMPCGRLYTAADHAMITREYIAAVDLWGERLLAATA